MSAFVGLDVHKEKTFATVLDQDGRVVAQRRIMNEHVPDFLKLFNVERVGLEASTHVAPLYRALVKEGFQALVSHPKKTRYIAEAKIKSDRVDSMAIAELVRRAPTLQSVETIHGLLERSPVNPREELPQPIQVHRSSRKEKKKPRQIFSLHAGACAYQINVRNLHFLYTLHAF